MSQILGNTGQNTAVISFKFFGRPLLIICSRPWATLTQMGRTPGLQALKHASNHSIQCKMHPLASQLTPGQFRQTDSLWQGWCSSLGAAAGGLGPEQTGLVASLVTLLQDKGTCSGTGQGPSQSHVPCRWACVCCSLPCQHVRASAQFSACAAALAALSPSVSLAKLAFLAACDQSLLTPAE